jgi:3-oxoadipate enol-lactonase
MRAKLVTDAPLAHLRWEGHGPTVILLHGGGGGREAWGDAVSRTGKFIAHAGYTVLAPDLPGYGDSPPIKPLTIAAMADAALALARSDDDAPCIVVGHSMGGMVAQQMIAHEPSRIAAMVICASSPAFGKLDGAWQRQFLHERTHLLDEGRGMRGLAPGLVRGMCAPDAPDANIAFATLMMSAVPEATYRDALQALMGFDQRMQLPRITVPVLCLAGEKDRNAPPAVLQQTAARIPGAEFHEMPGVGHLANLESPNLFNRAVVEFLLRRCPPFRSRH